VSVSFECGIAVRSCNQASSFEGGPRRMAKPKFPARTNLIQFPEIYGGSIPFCSEGVVFDSLTKKDLQLISETKTTIWERFLAHFIEIVEI